jgi:endonuclease/exonuclease/phosphatase family metal-dependent hydrolase
VRRDYYPHASDVDLDPARRRAALCERLRTFDAHVICLQEVEAAAFEAFAQALSGWKGCFAPKLRGKPDGCAVFVREPWGIQGESVTEFQDGEPRSGHIAHSVFLRQGEAELCVTNTHLKWDDPAKDPAEHVGCRQAEQLVGSLPIVPWILCGDLNATPDEPLLRRIRAAGLTPAHPDHAATCNAKGRVRKIDHLLHTAELSATAHPPGPLEPTTPLPSPVEPSDHLPLAATFR